MIFIFFLEKFAERSSLIYFYTPLLIIFTVNTVYFILTAMKIRSVQHDVAKMTCEKGSNRLQSHLNSRVDR